MLQTLFDKYKIQLMILISIILVMVVYFSNTAGKTSPVGEPLQGDFPVAAENDSKEEETAEKPSQEVEEIYVDVKGAVKKPGIYLAVRGERINDLIIRAGGFTPEAMEDMVNLAQKVADEMVIYVPAEGEEGLIVPAASPGSPAEKERLDINQAQKADFEELPGIGPAKAAAIVEFRTENGPFKTIEELQEVSGIGEGTFEKLKDSVTVH